MNHQIPRRKILTKDDLALFQASNAYVDYTVFIEQLNSSVQGKKIEADVLHSAVVTTILSILETLEQWSVDIPPVENKLSRFGNPAFRDFYDKVAENAGDLMRLIVPEPSILEVSRYFVESWGNRTRIDYGTGHEANFMAWLLCLQKLGVVGPEDHAALVLRVFVKYIALMRKLQFSYWLEPAGSHGVWGLDDYHFLPFMFGSSQLTEHKYIRPKSIHDPDTVAEFSRSYLYLACIQFINTIKISASLRWHSPMLDDISGVKTWAKVNEGMRKMYKAEVLGKLPIMQHFMFGSLIAFEGGTEGMDEMEEDEHGHVKHAHHEYQHGAQDGDAEANERYAMGQEYPDCCGIQVPSAIAAAVASGALNGINNGAPAAVANFKRAIPFD